MNKSQKVKITLLTSKSKKIQDGGRHHIGNFKLPYLCNGWSDQLRVWF